MLDKREKGTRESRNQWRVDVRLTFSLLRLFVLVDQKKCSSHGQFQSQFILTLFQLRETLLPVGLLTHLQKYPRTDSEVESRSCSLPLAYSKVFRHSNVARLKRSKNIHGDKIQLISEMGISRSHPTADFSHGDQLCVTRSIFEMALPNPLRSHSCPSLWRWTHRQIILDRTFSCWLQA